MRQRALADTAIASVDSWQTTSKPSSGRSTTNLRNASRTASNDAKMSTWSSSTEVRIAVRGR